MNSLFHRENSVGIVIANVSANKIIRRQGGSCSYLKFLQFSGARDKISQEADDLANDKSHLDSIRKFGPRPLESIPHMQGQDHVHVIK
jgi:hypothetical protein